MIGVDKGTLAFAIRRVNGGQTSLDKLTGTDAATILSGDKIFDYICHGENYAAKNAKLHQLFSGVRYLDLRLVCHG